MKYLIITKTTFKLFSDSGRFNVSSHLFSKKKPFGYSGSRNEYERYKPESVYDNKVKPSFILKKRGFWIEGQREKLYLCFIPVILIVNK